MTALFLDITDKQWPIVFDSEYDVKFYGLEKLHPFDAGKWGRIANDGILHADMFVKPNEAQKSDLLMVHTPQYLRSLKVRHAKLYGLRKLVNCFEIPVEFQCGCHCGNSAISGCAKQDCSETVFKTDEVGGTVLAGKLSLDRGWAINLGGGFHHCSATRGGGFCPYADITLLVEHLRVFCSIDNIMIVDLDAHQGNGYESDLINDPNIYILDVYNADIYPRDHRAKKAIRRKVELTTGTGDGQYLELVEKHLRAALREFRAQIIIYNAGTDVLAGDPLGGMSISPAAVIQRDEVVFKMIRSLKIPIVMLTSGGYLKKSAQIIAASIGNLKKLSLIGPKEG